MLSIPELGMGRGALSRLQNLIFQPEPRVPSLCLGIHGKTSSFFLGQPLPLLKPPGNWGGQAGGHLQAAKKRFFPPLPQVKINFKKRNTACLFLRSHCWIHPRFICTVFALSPFSSASHRASPPPPSQILGSFCTQSFSGQSWQSTTSQMSTSYGKEMPACCLFIYFYLQH